MYNKLTTAHLIAALVISATVVVGCQSQQSSPVDTGVRPHYLIGQMAPGPLKTQLQACAQQPNQPSVLSIAHRGAPLQFPEHTVQSYRAAAQQGARRIECDVAVTKDDVLVCRHAQCDLHSTTNILSTELAGLCRRPFTPADPNAQQKVDVQCCASDLSFEQFKSLCGRMESHNADAQSIAEYQAASPGWRTDLYNQCGELVSHQESIELIDSLGADFIPELKPNFLQPPTQALSASQRQQRARLADRLLQEYKTAGISPERVWPQSFLWQDIEHWLQAWPDFAPQVVWLDGRARVTPQGDVLQPTGVSFAEARTAGLNYLAPPLWVLLRHDAQTQDQFDLTQYARDAQVAGFQLITWSLERSGPIDAGSTQRRGYFRTLQGALANDGDLYPFLDALVTKAKVSGVFSDWPATVTYYDNCLNPSVSES